MTLTDKLTEMSQEEIERVLSQASSEAARIIEEAGEVLETETERMKDTIDKRSADEAESGKSTIELNARMEIGKFLEEIYEALKKKILNLAVERINEDVTAFFARAIVEGARNIGANEVALSVPASLETVYWNGQKKIYDLVSGEGIAIRDVSFALRSQMGIVVYDKDKKKLFNNTVEERFRRIEDEFKEELFNELKRLEGPGS